MWKTQFWQKGRKNRIISRGQTVNNVTSEMETPLVDCVTNHTILNSSVHTGCTN